MFIEVRQPTSGTSHSGGAITPGPVMVLPPPPAPEPSAEAPSVDSQAYLGKLPPEIGTMLILVGIVGVILPGPVGTPMLLAGAVVCWPRTFSPMERSFARLCPALHREGVRQIQRFLADLERRFPVAP